jgi:hypothetical protein
MLSGNSCKDGEKQENESPSNAIDMVQARKIIEGRGKQFSEYYINGDSLALAAMYAKDGTLGSIKGKDLISV